MPAESEGTAAMTDLAAACRERIITADEARQVAQRLINSYFGNDNRARMSIPTRPWHDDDCLIMEYIAQRERALLAALKVVEAARAVQASESDEHTDNDRHAFMEDLADALSAFDAVAGKTTGAEG